MGEGIPRLVKMHEKYGKDGLVILTVTLDSPKDAEARAKVEQFLAKKKPPFRTVNLDAEPDKLPTTLDFGGGVPGAFVFNRANRYIKKVPLVKGDKTLEDLDYGVLEKAAIGALEKK
jgi:hypothetical protein